MNWLQIAVSAALIALLMVVGYVFYVPVPESVAVGDVVIVQSNNVGETDFANGVAAIAIHHVQLQEALDATNGK